MNSPKTTITIWILASMTCLMSYGQVDFGIKAGINHARILVTVSVPGYGTGAAVTEYITSFHAGIFMTAPLGQEVKFQLEAMYSRQGGTLAGGPTSTLHYLNVPALIKLGGGRGNFQIGPQLGFLMDTSEGSPSSLKLNTVDFSAVVGVGYDAPSGVQLAFRFAYGISDLGGDYSGLGLPPGITITSTNQVLQLTLAVPVNRKRQTSP